jgi:hypothetical protein
MNEVTTPKAAASVGVATPKYMVPNTINMSTITGKSDNNPRSRTRQEGAASRGATDGQTLAATAMMNMKIPASKNPGMNPARYSLPMDSSASTP